MANADASKLPLDPIAVAGQAHTLDILMAGRYRGLGWAESIACILYLDTFLALLLVPREN